MATAPAKLSMSSAVDPSTGRLKPVTDSERKARTEALRRWLDELAAAPSDKSETDESWSEEFQNIDSSRPHRPLFEGLY